MTGRGRANRHYEDRLIVLMTRAFEEMNANDFVDENTAEVKIGDLEDLRDNWQNNNTYLMGGKLLNNSARRNAIDAILNHVTVEVEDMLLDRQNEGMANLSSEGRDALNEKETTKQLESLGLETITYKTGKTRRTVRALSGQFFAWEKKKIG